MSLKAIRANITNLPFKVDVIVNSADTEVGYNFGLDRAIYHAAGEEKLLAARKNIGIIPIGDVKSTDAYGLKDKTKKIFHVVVPYWEGGHLRELSFLRNCYQRCLDLALKEKFSSIAFPILGAGYHGFPINESLRVAIAESVRFLLYNNHFEITLVTFDKDFEKCKKIFPKSFVKQFITNSDVQKQKNEDDIAGVIQFLQNKSNKTNALLNKGFLQKLSEFMQRTGLNLDTPHDLKHIAYMGNISDRVRFSIRNAIKEGIDYNPSKNTAIRFAVALRLSTDDTIELLNSAGYTLYRNNEFDRKVLNFIFQNQNIPENYTIKRIGAEISEFAI